MAGGASVCPSVRRSRWWWVFSEGGESVPTYSYLLQDADHMIQVGGGGGSFNRDSGSVFVSLCRRDRGEGAVGPSAAGKVSSVTECRFGRSVSVKKLPHRNQGLVGGFRL